MTSNSVRIDGGFNLRTRMGKVWVNGVIGNSPGPRKDLSETEALFKTEADPVTGGTFTLHQNLGNEGPNYWDDGIGIHTQNSYGLRNPGLKPSLSAIEDLAVKSKAAGKQLIISIAGFTSQEFAEMAAMLEGLDVSVELDLGCPNTDYADTMFALDSQATGNTLHLVRRVYSGNLIAKLNYHSDFRFIQESAQVLSDEGADAVALINSLIGIIFDYKKLEPVIGLSKTYAGTSGQAINPLMLAMVHAYRTYLSPEIDIIAEGGINSGFDILAARSVGAGACRNANLYVRKGVQVFEDLTRDFSNEMLARGFKSLSDLPRSWETKNETLD